MIQAITIVVLSGFLHSLWNVCTKKSLNKESFLFSVQFVSFIIFAPICLPKILEGNFSANAWFLFLASAAVHGFYFILLARLYTISDLSQSYPIIRGSSLFIIPLCGVMFLNESISIIGWIGIAIILSRLNYKILVLALCVGLSIASYVIIDRFALKYIDPITLNQIGTAGNIVALLPIILHHKLRTFKQEWSLNYKAILIGAILAPSSYILFLWAIETAPVSILAPIREIGTVFGAIIGVFFLKERNGKSRIISSIIITVGMILLGLFN